jgi:hypothetical protein
LVVIVEIQRKRDLSAILHGRGDSRRAAAVGAAGLAAVAKLASLDDERGMLYFDLIRAALSVEARKVIEAMIPQGYKFQSDFARKYFAEGKAEGEARGEARGESRGEAKALIAVLDARGLSANEAQRERILACSELAQLERWIRRAVTIADVAELFANED